MITLVSLAQTYTLEATAALSEIGTHFMVYVPATTECPCEFLPVGPFIKQVYTETFDYEIVQEIKAMSGVKDAAPYLTFLLNNLTIGGIQVSSLATSTNVVAPEEVLEGRYLEPNDFDSILLDQVFASLMDIRVDDRLEAFNHTFRVIGIVNPSLHSRPGGIAQMYSPIETVQEIADAYSKYNYLIGGDANAVLVEIVSEGDADYLDEVKMTVLEALEAYIGRKGTIVGYGCDVQARNIIPITEESAWIISTILVASVILFSLKTQLGSVVERSKEIGILKAIGWADSDITIQLMLESVLQGLAGGIIGACIGYTITFVVPSLNLLSVENFTLSVSPLAIFIGLAATLFGAVLAGTLPALKAARLEPAESLRRF